MLEFTTEELRIIVYMCQIQGSQVFMRDIDSGKGIKAAGENYVYNSIGDIAQKAYNELRNRDFADK